MKRLQILFALIILFFSFSCEETATEENDINTRLNDAWSLFEAGNYLQAEAAFQDALDLDSLNTEGLLGLSFSLLKNSQLEQAVDAIDKAITVTDTIAHFYAAKAFLENAQEEFAKSNTSISSTLALDDNWTFERGLSLSTDHLYATQAQNFYALGDFEAALVAVKKVDASFNADLSSEEGKDALASKIQSFNQNFSII